MNNETYNKITSQEISLPKGGGAIKGIGETFQPNAFSGSSGLSIPFPATPARGFEPKLSLDYGSGSGNSAFGLGFSLSLPKVSRKTDTGIPKYEGYDTFILTGQGQLTPRLKNDNGQWVIDETTKSVKGVSWNVVTYLPREEAAYSLIEHWINPLTMESFWQVISRDNVTSIFGKNAVARIANPDDDTKIFEWLIEETFDSKGNRFVYNYKQEDGKNIPKEIYNVNRSFKAQKYIHSIQYGNYFPDPASEVEDFTFEVVFDYGEYNLTDLNKPNSNPYTPVNEWLPRLDPFSTYRSGFEIRTYRLCRNIMMFHNFKELGNTPSLASRMQLAHDKTKTFSFLTSITQTGYRINKDESYTSQSMPSLDFEYSQFTPPIAPVFNKLTVDEHENIPGYINKSNFQAVDLNREGLPGFLYSNAETTLYYEPQGNGAYNAPLGPTQFPITKNFQNPNLSLKDLDGDGQLELVVNSPSMAGYYSRMHDQSWSSFQAFKAMPTDRLNPYSENVDLAGNGKSDIVVLEEPDMIRYPSDGKNGYGSSKRIPLQEGFPAAVNYGEEDLVTYGNIFGDGLAHRVRIRDGSVEAWPNLGYGVFGKKVTLGNAPRFDSTTKVSTIFLADVDGSGTMDLVFAYADRVEVYLNQSGNSFADQPVTIMLPGVFSDIDQIQFADILGQGTSALVFTKIEPEPIHWYYNFCGEIKPDTTENEPGFKYALKPYLMFKTDNNLGATTLIKYASSTKFYLEDKKAGRPWVTSLPFPVQVVEKTIIIDNISGSKLTSSYKYHDGYYDQVEREFRGFGFVESCDTETIEEFDKSGTNPDFPVNRLNSELYVPPVYTKTWHHTGAYIEKGVITKQYEKEYYQGDPDAYDFPDSVLNFDLSKSSAETIRQAYVALKGAVMRQEVYGFDNGHEQGNPYTVTESNLEVNLIQAREGQRYAVFKVNPRESISYQYERNPADPRVQQEFTLKVDPLSGAIQKSCTVSIPRRSNLGSDVIVYPEQQDIKATAVYNNYIDTKDTDLYRHRGLLYQAQEFEIFGLKLTVGKHYFSYDNIKPVKTAVETPVHYESAIPPGSVQARQLTWNRSYYWNEGQTEALLLGGITPLALLHHNESAVFTKEFVTDIFGARLTDDTIKTKGGYIFDKSSGYWWNKGLTQYYLSQDQPTSFYMPYETANSFVDVSSPLYLKTTLEYDFPYFLSPVKVMQFIDETNPDPDKRANTETAKIDYITHQPYQLVDINGNVSQALFDPLGQVIVTTLFGTENGSPVGGMRLYPYNGEPEQYKEQNVASFNDVLANSENYLQGATSYFYYNLFAWKSEQQPPSSINLIRDDFYQTSKGVSDFSCKTSINYTNGFGRELESKLKTDPGMAFIRGSKGELTYDKDNKPVEAQTDDRWIVSGRTVYNNKGKPCEQYLPYFSNTPLFETQKEIVDEGLVPPPTVIHYDPLLRVIRIDTPIGFFSKVEFTPWEEKHYDEDDTVKDSAYYIDFMKNYPEKATQKQKDEKDALDKAAKFYNTPSISVLDNLDNKIRDIVNNLGNVSPDSFNDIVKGTSITSLELFNDLIAKGYLKTNTTSPIGTWVANKFQPYATGFVLKLSTLYQQFATQVTDLLKQNSLTSYLANDIQGRETESIDPRLYYSNQTNGTAYFNFKYKYAMGEKDPVYINSIDAGVEKHLSNIFDNQLWSFSARAYCQLISYDPLQRRSAVYVKNVTSDQPIISYSDFNLVEVFTYGETVNNARTYNLRGQLYQAKDLSGIVVNSQYSLHGELLETSRQMAVEYKTAIDWNKTPQLEQELYAGKFTYNALKLLITETTPDGSVTTNRYNQAGLLNQAKVVYEDKSADQIIDLIDYDAKGQRTTIHYGNGVITNYTYEPTTFHLTGLHSARPNGAGTESIQNITYTYDPVGNITRSWNKTFETVFNNNQKVDPLSQYIYDALYRLTNANGRQHPGITANTYKNNSNDNDFKQSKFSRLPALNDKDKLENYQEVYTYDDSGNLINKQHSAASSSWAREIPVEDNSNHLKGLKYDASGNMRRLDINNLVNLSFNCCENLVSAGVIERPDELDDCDYYVYDSNEQRTRKVSERMAHGGPVTIIEDKIYIGNYEITRNKSVNAQGVETTTMEKQTLRVMDGSTCVVIMKYCVIGKEAGTRKLRFQMDNNLGSVSSEYDNAAKLISYEEYFPYGGTAIIAGSNQAEVKLKEYRYSGKERDDSTGLYYYGRRYYAPWLGRWLNPDPAGTVDGMNLYAFVRGNPVTHVDAGGLISTSSVTTKIGIGFAAALAIGGIAYLIRRNNAPAGPPVALPPVAPPPIAPHPAPVDQAGVAVAKAGLTRQKIKGTRDPALPGAIQGLTPGLTLTDAANPRASAGLWPGSRAWPGPMRGVNSAYGQRSALAGVPQSLAGGQTSWGHQLAMQWGGPAAQYNAASATNSVMAGGNAQEDYQTVLENAVTAAATGDALNAPIGLNNIRIKHTAYLYAGTNVAQYMRMKVYVLNAGVWEKRIDQTTQDNAPRLTAGPGGTRALRLQQQTADIRGGAALAQKHGTSPTTIYSDDTANIQT